jgi:hypothetical protein
MNAVSADDRSQIADLTGFDPAVLQVLASHEETRLKFNSPTAVRFFLVRAGDRTAEIFNWVADGEWELLSLA